MIQINLASLVKHLNQLSRQALEAAAAECMGQQASEITVAHVLLQMLTSVRSDVRVIAEKADIDTNALRRALTVENYATVRATDSYPAFSPMLVEWLKEGWLLASAEMQHSELRGGMLLLALLHSPLRYVPPVAARLLTAINRDQLQQDFAQWTRESAETVMRNVDGPSPSMIAPTGDNLLSRYAKNMTEDARQGQLDPVLCRDHEIDLMIDILCRRRKNNPVVVGEAGVGKSALIEGLALRIVAGQVPDKLKNTDIMTLDLKGLGIKAIQYQYGGQVYVKITGYASLRRILQGTRYKINSPQILELGIGKAGINGGILEGAKFCIWFSLAYRTVQLIFKSDHDVAAFIGNITMDIAKIIVTIFVTKILVMAGGALTTVAASFGVIFPIAAGIVLIIGVGFLITLTLDYLDRKYHLSDKLISVIREGMKSQAEIEKWNFEHTSPFTYGLMNTHW